MIRLRNENTAKYIAKNSTKRKYYGLEHWSMYNLCAFFRIFYHSYTVITHSRKCAYKKNYCIQNTKWFWVLRSCRKKEKKRMNMLISIFRDISLKHNNAVLLHVCLKKENICKEFHQILFYIYF